jgi:GT2 family glycosyltransferase
MLELSVVIVSYNSRETIEGCLRSLERQTIQPAQIVVVDSGKDGAAGIIAALFPRVELLKFPDRKYPGDARNIGVGHASGKLVAFLDSDCIADPHWAAEILAAHQRPDPIIGGAVDNATSGSAVAWARYFSEFSRWMPSLAGGHMRDVPTCSMSIKLWAFERFGPFLEGTYCSDTAFCWRAGDAGYPPLFAPAIRVSHITPARLGAFFKKQTMHGKTFAKVRVREKRLSRWQTALLFLGSPALPFLLFGRLIGRMTRSRSNLPAFVSASPFVLAGMIAWSWGEALGYAACLRIGGWSKNAPKPVEHPA